MSLSASAYLATSLDGFIARADGALDWLEQVACDGEDYGYADFMATVDVLLMGSATFRKVLSFPEWPYAGLRVVVASRSLRPPDVPAALRSQVALSAAELPRLLTELRASGARHVYVDGGRLVSAFLRAGLLDQLILNRVPVLLGAGIPLFSGLDDDIRLQHQSTRAYASGLLQSSYSINRAADAAEQP
ncbi:dihydrofolate reductase [Chromobacterium haemolyticum]|uniref:Dihydrofolate reductase n=1 Tax=Chromobacterium fluminis TaxID=3044269 RepID=A0ABX0L4G1_9NEIS|nr:dihydrofolate reductase family protein [Chromobacterium haemolyticum]NHR06595.1 dihydrofolate reductase [Chromobacterium haemolyticum]